MARRLTVLPLRTALTQFVFGAKNNEFNKADSDDQVQIKDGKIISSSADENKQNHVQLIQHDIEPNSSSQEETIVQNTEEIESLTNPKSRIGRLPAPSRFWTYLEISRSKKTVIEYRYEWSFWEKKAQASGCTIYTLKIHQIEASLKGMHPATARRKLSFLRVLAKWYLREDYPRLHAEVNKVLSPRLPKQLPKDLGPRKFLELRNEAKKLCLEKKREGVFLGLMLTGGLRISEIQTVKITGDKKIKVLGKGDKERIVPIPDWLIHALETLPKNGKNGWCKSRFVIWKALNKKDITKPHSLRHTFASELLRRGTKIEEIQILLGHENISTTNIYAKIHAVPNIVELLEKDI